MLARLFPLNPEQIIQESLEGMTSVLWALPVSVLLRCTEDIIVGASPLIKVALKDKAADKSEILENEIKKYEKIKTDIKNTTLSRADMLRLCIIIPVLEEVFFRSLLTTSLQAGLPYIGLSESLAPIASSLIFGALHHPGTKSYSTYLGYRAQNLSTQHNGSLWASVATHITNNALVLMPRYLFKKSVDESQESQINSMLKSLNDINRKIKATTSTQPIEATHISNPISDAASSTPKKEKSHARTHSMKLRRRR